MKKENSNPHLTERPGNVAANGKRIAVSFLLMLSVTVITQWSVVKSAIDVKAASNENCRCAEENDFLHAMPLPLLPALEAGVESPFGAIRKLINH